MSAERPDNRELDAFRDEADRFIAELDEESYLHYAGHKETLDVEAIYARYEELSQLETAQRLEGAPTELWRFACEGFLGNLTRGHQERLARSRPSSRRRSTASTIPYRMLRVGDLERARPRPARSGSSAARLRLLDEQLNPVYLEAARIDREAVSSSARRTTTSSTSASASASTSSPPSARELLDARSGQWEEAADRLLPRAARHRPLRRAAVGHAAPLPRARAGTRPIRPDEMVPALEETLRDLGIDLDAQANVHLDLEQRPGEEPARVLRADRGARPRDARDRADRRPRRLGGALPRGRPHRALRAHLAPTCRWRPSASATWRSPRAGRRSSSTSSPSRRGSTGASTSRASRQLANEGAVVAPLLRRAATARSCSTRSSSSRPTTRRRCGRATQELLTEALKLPANAESYLDDIDGSFYVTGYLRSWAFEAQLRDFLRSEFGNEWFARREAGGLLRELWSLGQGPTADELLRDVTGAELEMAAVADRIREGLAA